MLCCAWLGTCVRLTSLHRCKAKQFTRQAPWRADRRSRSHPTKLDHGEIHKTINIPLLLILSMAEHNCLHMTDFGHYFWQYGMGLWSCWKWNRYLKKMSCLNLQYIDIQSYNSHGQMFFGSWSVELEATLFWEPSLHTSVDRLGQAWTGLDRVVVLAPPVYRQSSSSSSCSRPNLDHSHCSPFPSLSMPNCLVL